MDNSNSPTTPKIHDKKKKRNRFSKLDAIYYPLAHLLLENARLQLAGKRPLGLERIAMRIEDKHGISIHKSSLSRYINKHGALKLL